MLGYLLWAADQMAALARARAAVAGPAAVPEYLARVTVPAGRGSEGTPGTGGPSVAETTARQHPVASRAQLAPGLGTLSKIAMSIAMGYMLLLMV